MSLKGALCRRVLMPVRRLFSAESARRHRLLRELEESQWWAAARLRDLQAERLRDIGGAAWKTPFYKKRFGRCGLSPSNDFTPEDLAKMPPLTKDDIRRYGEDLLDTSWPKEDLHPHRTGGSTGEPITVYAETDSEFAVWAMVTRHNRWAGWDFGERFALLWGATRDAMRRKKAFFETFSESLLTPRLWLNAFRMNRERMAEFADLLNRFKPRCVQSYASAAFFFAQYIQATGKELTFRPFGIITSADPLCPEYRPVIESVFGCPVFNRYGCREVMTLASECEAHAGLHVCAEHFIVEIVRPDFSPCAPGEAGEVLVTSLTRRAMPLIRYAIGDTAVLEKDEPCPCGRQLPRLREVQGRASDIFRLPGGTIVHGIFFSSIFYGNTMGVQKFQVIQDELDHFEIKLVVDERFQKAVVEKFRKEIEEFLEPGIRLDFRFVPEIEPGPTGKHRFAVSKVS
jgi:phenylacetate-CoA ligase